MTSFALYFHTGKTGVCEGDPTKQNEIAFTQHYNIKLINTSFQSYAVGIDPLVKFLLI